MEQSGFWNSYLPIRDAVILAMPSGGYLYPVFSSIVAATIFWILFAYIPERAKKRGFGVGITNDLLILNSHIFGYFDFFLKFHKHSPSVFQDKIHSSTLSRDDLNVALQNKVIIPIQLSNAAIQAKLIAVGVDLMKMVASIDEVINRLYAFNYFLSSKEVALLRNIYEKIHRYIPYIEMSIIESHRRDAHPLPVNPSLTFMAEVLLELQEDFRQLRSIVFSNRSTERSYVVSKIQWQFYSGQHKACAKECRRAIRAFPADSSLQTLYLIRCCLSLNQKSLAYLLLNDFVKSNANYISHRDLLYPLLSDPIALEIMQKRGNDQLTAMKQLCENEVLKTKQCISSNEEIRKYFAPPEGHDAALRS